MSAIYSGVSGLDAQQQAMDVIANNIANVNTTGYKASQTNFVDTLSNTLFGGSTDGQNPMQVGSGVAVGSIAANMAQGNLQATGISSDCALQGNGFFILGNGTESLLTRNGGFSLDANDRLISTDNGLPVLGWQADPITGAVDTSAAVGPNSGLTIPLGTMSQARATGNVVYQSNLDATTAVGDTVTTSFSVYDSLGNSHQVELDFTKTADNTWTWSASGNDFDPSAPATGTVTFDSNGQCQSSSLSCSLSLLSPNGASNPMDFSVNTSAITQLAGNSSVSAVSQDGLPMGTLTSYSIDKTGMIIGQFSNGMTQDLGQIAVASVNNPDGLAKTGGSLYSLSPNSGMMTIATAGQGGCGTIASGNLELSNVDLAQEFANLIVTQRGFEANSRIVTTADQLMQDTVAMKTA